MSVGKQLDKATLDAQISAFGTLFNAGFNQVGLYTGAVDAQSDAQLIALGYIQAEVNSLRAAYRDLNKFRQVYNGTMYVAAGATLNTGVPTANDATHWGYPFNLNVSSMDGLGY